jgi:hypothetical protein
MNPNRREEGRQTWMEKGTGAVRAEDEEEYAEGAG